MFEQFKNAGNIPGTHSLLYFQWLMFEYLLTIFMENGETEMLLKRDWNNGIPLESFSQEEPPHLYVVDQTGGLFFDNAKQMNEYFKLSTWMICELWHFSLQRKKNFMLAQLLKAEV